MDYVLSLHMPEHLAEWARARAAEEDRSLSSLIRYALVDYLERVDSPVPAP